MDAWKMLLLFTVMFGGACSISLESPPSADLLLALLSGSTMGEEKDMLVIAPPKLVGQARYQHQTEAMAHF